MVSFMSFKVANDCYYFKRLHFELVFKSSFIEVKVRLNISVTNVSKYGGQCFIGVIFPYLLLNYFLTHLRNVMIF